MNPYVRETRKILESLGLVRRPASSWLGVFWAGAGLGVVTGAAVGALFLTPAHRTELKKLVRSKVKSIAASADDKASEIATPGANGAAPELVGN